MSAVSVAIVAERLQRQVGQLREDSEQRAAYGRAERHLVWVRVRVRVRVRMTVRVRVRGLG